MLINYVKKDNTWVEIRQVVEEQGRSVDQNRRTVGQLPLTQSPLLFLILAANRSVEERDKFIEVVEKIREISVSGRTLGIRA